MEWVLTAGTSRLYNSKIVLWYFKSASLTWVCFGPAVHSVAMGLSSATEILRSVDLGWRILSGEALDGTMCRSGWIYLTHLGEEHYGSWSSVCLIKSLLWTVLSMGHSQLETAIVFSPRYHCTGTFPWTSNTLLSLRLIPSWTSLRTSPHTQRTWSN